MRLETISQVATAVSGLMSGYQGHWGVAGGWALDLFLGRVTRPHDDVELAIFRQDQMLLHRQLPGWTFQKVVEGRLIEWPAEEQLTVPIHEIHGRLPRDPSLSLEFLLNERIGDDWVFRRDSGVRLQMQRAIQVAECGMPILSPAIVLLFKAKNPRVRDEIDFRSVCGGMNLEDREWFGCALRACHPDHPWLNQLHLT